jgi:Skp family chaperone for outer membrane proteins
MKKTALAVIVFFAMMGVSQAAPHHPRRAEVNLRLARQNYRIDKKVADGQMSNKEAAKLHHEDHQIRQEEKDMASQDGGHITKQEQKTLNQQENHVSKQIRNH